MHLFEAYALYGCPHLQVPSGVSLIEAASRGSVGNMKAGKTVLVRGQPKAPGSCSQMRWHAPLC
jgi:hypothetical protein